MMISTAWAQDAAATAGANDIGAVITSALPLVLVFAIFYFFVMRPPMIAAKKHAEMLSELKKGDIVVTDGGLIGEVQTLMPHLVHLRVNDSSVTVAREAVRSVLGAEASKGWEAKDSGGKKR